DVDADHPQRPGGEAAAAQRVVAHERVDVGEPGAVAAAAVQDESWLGGQRLAVEDRREERIGVGEVARVRGGAGTDVQLALDVPAVPGGRRGELARVELRQAGERGQVGGGE